MPGVYAGVTALSFLPQLTALNDSPLDYLSLRCHKFSLQDQC